MGGIGPIQSPSVNNFNGQGGLLGFISSALNGYNQAIGERKNQAAQSDQLAMQKQEMQFRNKQIDFETQKYENEINQQKQAQSKAKYNQLSSMFTQNPAYAKDPALQQAWNDSATAAGIPAMRNADGTPNIDALKPQWNALDDKTQAFIQQLPVTPRRAQLQKYGGVPKDVYTNTAYVTNKDQIAYAKLAVAQGHEHAYEQAQTKGMAIRQELANINKDLEPARYRELMSQSQLATTKASLAPSYLQNSMRRTDIEGQRLQLAVTKFKSSPSAGGRSTLIQAANSATRAYNSAFGDYQTASKNYANEIAGGADPDDSNVQQAAQVLQQANDRLTSLKSMADEANSLVISNMGTNASLTSQNGVQSQIVEKKSSTSNIQYSTSKSGKRIMSNDGGQTWEYAN